MSQKKTGIISSFNQSTKFRNFIQVSEKANFVSVHKDTKQNNNFRSCSVDKKRPSFQLEIITSKYKIKGILNSAKTQRNNKKYKPIIRFSYRTQIQNQFENEIKNFPIKTSYEKSSQIKYHEGSKTPMNCKVKQPLLLQSENQIDFQSKKKSKFNHSLDSSDSFSKTILFQRKNSNKIITCNNAIMFLGNNFINKNKKVSLDSFEEVKYIGLLFSILEHKKINKNIREAYQEINKNNKIFEFILISNDITDKDFVDNYSTLPGLTLPYDKKYKKAKELHIKYDIKNLPSLIVINKSGKVLMKLNKKQIINNGLKKLIDISKPQKIIEPIIETIKGLDFKKFIDQFKLTYLNGEEVLKHNMLHLSLIAYYKPSKDKYIRFKEESILNQIYLIINATTWKLGLIVVKQHDQKYKLLHNLQKRKFFPLMEVNCNLAQFESKDLECDGLIILDNKHHIISRKGFLNIQQYQYEVYNYWFSELSKLPIIDSSLYSNMITQSLGDLFYDNKNNIYSSIPNNEILLIHLYSNKLEDTIIENKIINYLYSILKNKITFVNININQENQIKEESIHLVYSGLYIKNLGKDIINCLTNRFNIELTSSPLPKIILSTNYFTLIKEYHKNDIIIKGINVFNNIINPSFYFNIENLKHILSNSFGKDTKRIIDLLSTFNLICLYFGDSESVKSKSITTSLVEVYNIINRTKKRIEIIYYPQDKTLRHLKNATKEVPFPCFDFDSNDIYSKYNKGKKYLKLMLIDLNGNIIIDNAIDVFIEKGEALFKDVFESYLGISYDTSSEFQCAFLGQEFIDSKGKRVNRDYLLNIAFIGLYFSSARCPFSNQFNIQLIKFINQIQSNDYNKKKNLLEIIMNPIDDDKDLYYSLQKQLSSIIVPFDYKDILIKRFEVLEKGLPCLLIFDSIGNLKSMNGVEDIISNPSKAIENWGKVK